MDICLHSVVDNVESKLTELVNRPVAVQQPPVNDRTSEIIDKLSKTESLLTGQVARLEFELDSMAVKLKDDSTTQSEKIQVVSGEVSISVASPER